MHPRRFFSLAGFPFSLPFLQYFPLSSLEIPAYSVHNSQFILPSFLLALVPVQSVTCKTMTSLLHLGEGSNKSPTGTGRGKRQQVAISSSRAFSPAWVAACFSQSQTPRKPQLLLLSQHRSRRTRNKRFSRPGPLCCDMRLMMECRVLVIRLLLTPRSESASLSRMKGVKMRTNPRLVCFHAGQLLLTVSITTTG